MRACGGEAHSRLRTASLDIELFYPEAHWDWKNPKLEQLSTNTRKIYQNTKAGQVVFCDRVLSSDASLDIHQKLNNHRLKAVGF